jgi:transcriptional regulator with XRE-family HTH domain
MKRFKKSGTPLPHYMRAWREARGISLDEMTRRIGLSKPSLSRIENGKTPYYQDVLEAYAEVLDCTPGDLLTRKPTDPEELWAVWDTLREEAKPVGIRLLKALAANGTG